LVLPNYAHHDAYWSGLPDQLQKRLSDVREAIESAVGERAPELVRCISYGMPAFRKGLKGPVLVYIAAYERHIGFYPTGAGIAAFEHRLDRWKHSKGAVQFPHDAPLPLELITEMTLYRWDTTAQ